MATASGRPRHRRRGGPAFCAQVPDTLAVQPGHAHGRCGQAVIIRKPGGRWLPVRVDDFDGWLTGLLEESAARLDATLAAEGRVLRRYCAGSPVMFRGERAWLRVSPFLENEMDQTAWSGTADAGAIQGLATPALLARIEWLSAHPVPVAVSAEILTLVTEPAASPDRFLRDTPEFSATWFSDLRRSLAVLASWPTSRRFRVHDAEQYERLLHATYLRVPDETRPELGTEHLDLVWGNITVPGFQIIDMEHWGLAVQGFGAAYLFLTAMGVPAVAERVRQELSGVLDCPSGRYAQLVAAALILRDLTRLPDPGALATRLHRHTSTLLI